MATPVDDADVAEEDVGQPSPVEGALGELIEVEERIEAEVAQAKSEAGRLVEQARESARTLEDDGSDSLQQALDRLHTSIEKERLDSERELIERAAEEVERYRGVDEATLRRLARWVASRVVGGSKDP